MRPADPDQRAVQASWQLRTWLAFLVLSARAGDWQGVSFAVRRLRRNIRGARRG